MSGVFLFLLSVFVLAEAGHFGRCTSDDDGQVCIRRQSTPMTTLSVRTADIDSQIVSCLSFKDEADADYLSQLYLYMTTPNSMDTFKSGYRAQRAHAASGTFLLPGDVVQRGGKQLLVVGYHGSGDQHLRRFLKGGIVPVPEKKKVYKAGQFGDGFYVTVSQGTAGFYNKHQRRRLVLVIAVEDFCTMTGIWEMSQEYQDTEMSAGGPNQWEKVWIDNKYIVEHLLREYDYIHDKDQIKFNRRAYPKLHIVGYYHQVPRPSPKLVGTSPACFEMETVNPEELPEMCWEYVSTF
eukprot:GILJ01000608.1.p1 GENE.GILJ01000608.1~~GILJ01000608.1.p1  ORF type:complete len:293 (-),score=39.32 GILJ01000608.1:357-1235(-)